MLRRCSRKLVARSWLPRAPRRACHAGYSPIFDGVVLGASERVCTKGRFKAKLSPAGQQVDASVGGRLQASLKEAKVTGAEGQSLSLVGLSQEWPRIVVVGVGKEPATAYEEAEATRKAAAIGTKALWSVGARGSFGLDPMWSAQGAVEGARLASFAYKPFKPQQPKEGEPPRTPGLGQEPLKFGILDTDKPSPATHSAAAAAAQAGEITASAQNFARKLAETPANLMTPTIFARAVAEHYEQVAPGKIKVTAHDQAWAESQGMGLFLSVSQGGPQPPVFLEAEYNGASSKDAKPLVLVGKGVTFDTGGISIKPSANMALMKGDMGGAAAVSSAFGAIAALGLPINVKLLVPLTENMPSGTATKPGDVFVGMNGKSVEIDNTDAEGRLILADALSYADTLSPNAVIDVATLTGAMDVALGPVVTGVFTNDDSLWGLMDKAGRSTGDRVWRMPLLPEYRKMMDSRVADLINTGTSRSAGSCTAAAFLKDFVQCDSWMHMDIAGVMTGSSEPYLDGKSMSGRPTRTLIEFARIFGAAEAQ